MSMGPGEPVDLDVVDAMAQTATANARQADQMWEGLQQRGMALYDASRSGSFAQGALAGRAAPAVSMGASKRAIT